MHQRTNVLSPLTNQMIDFNFLALLRRTCCYAPPIRLQRFIASCSLCLARLGPCGGRRYFLYSPVPRKFFPLRLAPAPSLIQNRKKTHTYINQSPFIFHFRFPISFFFPSYIFHQKCLENSPLRRLMPTLKPPLVRGGEPLFKRSTRPSFLGSVSLFFPPSPHVEQLSPSRAWN